MKCIADIRLIIILASFGNNYLLSAIACKKFHNGYPGSDDSTPQWSTEIGTELFSNLLNAHSKLIHTEHALIQPNSQPMCVVVVESTKQLAQTTEFQRSMSHFSLFKAMLLSNDFTVYEFLRGGVLFPTAPNRSVIFTHECIHNQNSCTTAAVTKLLADCSAFEYKFSRRQTGLQHYILHSQVTFIGQQRKDSLIDADQLLRSVNSKSDSACTGAFLNRLSARPDLILTNRAQIQQNPQFASPSSALQAALNCAQARCVEQVNVELHNSISEANRKRQLGQDVGGDVGGVRPKKPRSSSSDAVRELQSSVVDAARSSYGQQLNVGFDQSQMMELPSSIETAAAFHSTPDPASGPMNPPLSVPNYRPMEYYGEMTLSERDRSMSNPGPQQLISGFDRSQIELASWSELIASTFDNPPNDSSNVPDDFLKEPDEMSLNEQLEFISNMLDL